MMAQQQAPPQQPPGPMPPQVQQGARPGPVVVTNVVFVVDTSASMNQRIYNGLSLLDCAKAAIEHFLKVRGRDLRFDRLFLLTFDDGPSGIKVPLHLLKLDL
jgi:peptidoglycan/xylan/chitin deacetylase (PgdA/CDA1 family)